MPKSTEKRNKLLEKLVDAAERRIARQGLGQMRARDLAADLGIALGAIYNLVADLDELILRVSSRTLGRLDIELSNAGHGIELVDAKSAAELLAALAEAYFRFARDNPRLWRALFEHRMAAEKPFPDWAMKEQMRLMRHIGAPLARLMPRAPREEREMMERTLFSAAHGIVALGFDEKLVAVPAESIARQLRSFVLAACRGLAAEA